MAVATITPIFMEMRAVNPGSNRAYLLASSFLQLHRHIWPAAILVMLFVIVHALLFSHRIAGPMYRFRQIFLALRAGSVPGHQRLRKGDYLQLEMKLINEMLDSMRSKITAIQETQISIAGTIEGIAQRSRALSDKELSLLVKELDLKAKGLAELVIPIEK
jgi:methyl-accepting chemotaxis protein